VSSAPAAGRLISFRCRCTGRATGWSSPSSRPR
jgi:hypothetical protein